jgi:quinol monooxygenase YgiN
MIAVPEKEGELREVLRGLIGPTRNEPGRRRYEMYESEQKGRYFADEIWESREALDAKASFSKNASDSVTDGSAVILHQKALLHRGFLGDN